MTITVNDNKYTSLICAKSTQILQLYYDNVKSKLKSDINHNSHLKQCLFFSQKIQYQIVEITEE